MNPTSQNGLSWVPALPWSHHGLVPEADLCNVQCWGRVRELQFTLSPGLVLPQPGLGHLALASSCCAAPLAQLSTPMSTVKQLLKSSLLIFFIPLIQSKLQYAVLLDGVVWSMWKSREAALDGLLGSPFVVFIAWCNGCAQPDLNKL